MKDQRFIELLNLYIDRQISTAETAELEAEIQRNPKRQAVYRQYCKIHTATKVVYESFRAGAAEQAAVPASGRPATIELFESRRRRSNWAYYLGGAAVAACLAVIFVRQAPLNAAAGDELASAPRTAIPVANSPAPVAASPAVPAAVVVPAATPAVLRNSVTPPDYSAMLAALREQDEERALANAARVQSLFNDNFFETHRHATGSDVRVPRAPSSTSQQAEFTAFQFQR